MIMLHSGTILLGTGFALLALSLVIWDPTASNITTGAGTLLLVGLPVGTLGLAMILSAAAWQAWGRRFGRLRARGPRRSRTMNS